MQVRLKDLAGVEGLEVLRDGPFTTLGAISSRAEGRLVSVFDPAAATELSKYSGIAAAIVPPELTETVPAGIAIGTAPDPLAAFLTVHQRLMAVEGFYWTPFGTTIDPQAMVHPEAYIAPTDVRIGPGVCVEARAVVLERTILEDEVVIRSGAIVGAEGFELRLHGGRQVVVPHAGAVSLAPGVEIQSLATVVRSVFGGATTVGVDTKIAGRAQIGHFSRTGERCRIGVGAIVCGSAILEDEVAVAPGAIIANAVTVGKGALVGMAEVARRDIPPEMALAGGRIFEKRRILRSRSVVM